MSCNQWEQGTITLPTTAVTPLKQALRRAHNEMYDAILAVAKRWEPLYVDQKPRRGYLLVGLPEPRTEVERHAHQAISDRFHSRAGKDRLGRLVAADLNGTFGPRATNRTTEFRCWPGTACSTAANCPARGNAATCPPRRRRAGARRRARQ